MVTTIMHSSAMLRAACMQAPSTRQSKCAPPLCTANFRSLSCKSTFQGGRVAQASRAHQRANQQRQHSSLVVQAGLGDVGKYLSEAAAAVFSPTKEDVPWSGGMHLAMTPSRENNEQP